MRQRRYEIIKRGTDGCPTRVIYSPAAINTHLLTLFTWEWPRCYNDLSGLLDDNSTTIKRWETLWDTHFNVSVDSTIILFDQCIKPNRQGRFRSYQKEAIANGRPEEAWSETLMTTISNTLDNAVQDREGVVFRRTAPQIGIMSHIAEGALTIEVTDNGQGVPERIATQLKPGYNQQITHKGADVLRGIGLRSIYEAIEQIGGRVEVVTKRTEDLKPGEASGTTVRFIFSVNTPVESVAA